MDSSGGVNMGLKRTVVSVLPSPSDLIMYLANSRNGVVCKEWNRDCPVTVMPIKTVQSWHLGNTHNTSHFSLRFAGILVQGANFSSCFQSAIHIAIEITGNVM